MCFYLCFNKVDYVICTGPAQSVYLKKLRTIFRFNYKIYAWPHFSITSNFGEFRFCKHADYCLGISKDICKQFETIGVSKDKINFSQTHLSGMNCWTIRLGLELQNLFISVGYYLKGKKDKRHYRCIQIARGKFCYSFNWWRCRFWCYWQVYWK